MAQSENTFRCYGCMKEIPNYPCPHCGYDGRKNQSSALPCGQALGNGRNGKYLLGRVLKQDGFGITYVAWNSTVGKKFAVKEYLPDGLAFHSRNYGTAVYWSNNPQAQNLRRDGTHSVLQRAQKIAALSGIPGIAPVYDWFEENNTAYIVTDFTGGETLRERVNRQGPIPWKDAEKLFLPAIEAMVKLHAAGITHGGIGLDSLMLRRDGQIQILGLDETGTEANALADVSAMAATIYYALAGQPWTGKSQFDKLNAPKNVQKALQKALAVRAEDRTQTMEELLKELEPKPWPWNIKKFLLIATICAAASLIIGGAIQWMNTSAGDSLIRSSNTTVLQQTEKLTEEVIEQSTTATSAGTTSVQYITYSDHVEVSGYKGSPTAIEIPSEMYGRPVTDIGEDAFYGCTSLKSIAIPDSVTTIGVGAFRECDSLASITIPDSVTMIASSVFDGCTSLTSIALSDGVTAIRSHAFYGCSSLASITLPDSVTTIEDYAFTGCSSLTSIILPDGITTIGECTFWGCTSLANITIPDTVTAIGIYAFYECASLKSVSVPADAKIASDAFPSTIAVIRREKLAMQAQAIDCGGNIIFAIKTNGTVIAAGDDGERRNIYGWTDIVAVSTSDNHTVGLKTDGTVVAVGDNEGGQCNVSKWQNIVAISAGGACTVGLKADGTVIVAGDNDGWKCDVSDWKNIVAISAGTYHIVGLKGDGTVVATGYSWEGQCDVSEWENIAAIRAEGHTTVGLKKDGTVVAAGWIGESSLSDIVAIAVGDRHIVGLKANGTVVAEEHWFSDEHLSQCDVTEWKNIVAISASGDSTVGLRADGTVVVAGFINDYYYNSVSSLKDIRIPSK